MKYGINSPKMKKEEKGRKKKKGTKIAPKV